MREKNRAFLLVFILLLFCKLTLNAQEITGVLSRGKTYSLPDLYRIALKHSEKIKISEQDLYISERGREKALSVLKPDLSAFGNYVQFSEKKTYGDSVTQPESSTAWGLKLEQSLTLNGKELLEVKIAEDSIEKSKYDLYAVKELYLFNVASAYYDVLKARKAAEIAESNVERLEKHREDVSIRLKLEEVTKTALYRAEAELSKSQAELISSDNNLRLAKVTLARIAGLPQNYQIRGPGPYYARESEGKDDLDSSKDEALSNRAELKALNIRRKISGDMIQVSQSSYWPKLSVEGTYSNQDQDPSSDAINKDSLSVGLNLSFTLFDGGMRNAELKEALAERRQAELSFEDMSKQIAVEVEQAFLELITHRGILRSLEDQLQFAMENYNAVSKQFKYGLANSTDVMDANTLLVTSQKQLAESRYDLQLAVLKMERAKGSFLEGLDI